jgi:2'-5' RNA ligase
LKNHKSKNISGEKICVKLKLIGRIVLVKKRLFVGIKVGKGLRDEVSKWRRSFQFKLKARWINDDNLHITLVPPWYEGEVEEVIKRLSDLKIGVRPFEIQFRKIEFGPDRKGPRLVLATGSKPRQVVKLEKLLSRTLKTKPQRESNFIHLTLARFRPDGFKKFPVKRLDEKVSWKEKVESISLFESKLLRSGAEYKVLAELRL